MDLPLGFDAGIDQSDGSIRHLIPTSNSGRDARVLDLEYNKGDTVQVLNVDSKNASIKNPFER